MTAGDLPGRFWDYWKQTNALFNLQRGYLDYGDRMEDISAEGIAERRRWLHRFAEEAAAAPTATADDRVTMEVVAQVSGSRAGWLGWREDIYLPNHTMGLHSILFNALPRQVYVTREHAVAAVDRYHAIASMIDQLIERLGESAAAGITPHTHTVARTIDSLDGYLGTDPGVDRLLGVADPRELDAGAAAAWRQQLGEAVVSSVRPAFARYRDHLADVVLPAAQPDDRPGMAHVAGGGDHYLERIRAHTTTDASAEQIHQIGLDLVAELEEEYSSIGRSALGIDRPDAIYRRLRSDPELRYREGAAIVADAERAVARASAAMSEAFHRAPVASCVVRETDVGAAAFYQTPTTDGSRPGTFFINTADPSSWGTFETEALSFHEAVPGHHFERTLALERSDVPEVRHGAPITVFSEGWALYAERLADEMGLYTSDLDRLGMLANDSLRATRLVVDTGLHALGWSRDRAISYMVDNSPITPGRAADEVDRYLGLPGQALSYMMGRLEIVAMRRRASEALGGGFDLKDFHETVLGYGSVPMPTLHRIVADWLGR